MLYDRCRLPKAERNLLKDQLVGVVANALYYNANLALQALQQQGRTQAFFATWFQVPSHNLLPLTPCIFACTVLVCSARAHLQDSRRVAPLPCSCQKLAVYS